LESLRPLSHQQFIFQHSAIFCRAEQVNVAVDVLGFCRGDAADPGVMAGLNWLTVGSCERGNDPSGFRKLGGFHDMLSNFQLLKKDSVLRRLRVTFIEITQWAVT
jgi:hypothetical protein